MSGKGARKPSVRKSSPEHRPAGAAESNLSDQIIRGVPSGILAVDREFCVIAANPGAARILGVRPQELENGARLVDVKAITPFVDVVRGVYSSRAANIRKEVLLTVGGEHREIGLSISPLDGPGDFNGVMVLFADITERRNLERSAELNRQLATLGELTAGVVHELRNPLMVVSGMAELLMRDLDPSSKTYNSADIIFQEAQNLERAIAQFLSFAKPFEIAPAPCNPKELCDRIMQLCQPRAQRRSVWLQSTVAQGIGNADLDSARAAQAISNIVGNAIDAVEEKTGKVKLALSQDESELLFEITDNGPGIHLQDGEDLFKPFFTRKESGTGLGLAIAHRIISAHHGKVTYYNRPRGGACFEVRLPIERKRDW
jgi:two-component system sensor histidine kinase AtoS